MKTTRQTISKSSKRKMSSSFRAFCFNTSTGTDVTEIKKRFKANAKTEQVVYKTQLPGGKFKSITKHEIAR